MKSVNVTEFLEIKMMKQLTRKQIRHFQKTIYEYYERYGRKDLPWRKTRDPYRILVSEMMLQQTQVSRVIEKYEPFIRQFPDFESLARSPLRAILKAWSGLGYNRRALLLRKTAQIVVSEFDGHLPSQVDVLVGLPGIGKATAAGIAAFAFDKAYSLVETNIRTVFMHFFFNRSKKVNDADIVQSKEQATVNDADILALVKQTLDVNDPRRWYHALMDYGAMLKKKYPRLSLKSDRYVRQGRFKGSDRQARGLIVKALTSRSLNELELHRTTGLSLTRIRSNAEKLIREGMLVKKRTRFSIA